MGGLIGGKKTTRTTTVEPVANGIRLQTSAYGLIIPILYGTSRIVGNLIWYGGFTALPHYQTSSTPGAGKGGGGGSSVTNISWTYLVSFIFALCEGVIGGIQAIWANENSISNSKMNQYVGTYPQNPNYSIPFASNINYPGVALVTANNYDLEDNSTLPNFSFVINGLCRGFILTSVEGESHVITGTLNSISKIIPEESSSEVPPLEVEDWVADDKVEFAYILLGEIIPAPELTKVASDPGPGQYSVEEVLGNGSYTFNNEDAGKDIIITFYQAPCSASASAGQFHKDSGVTKDDSLQTPFVKVDADPGPDEYSVDETTGIYTFNCANLGESILINYIYKTDIGSHPHEVILDIMTSTRYGCGWHTDKFDSLENYRIYCTANGLFFSPQLVQEEDIQSIMERWLNITNSELVWSEGKIKIIPRGDVSVTGNGETFTPSLSPLYDLTVDDFIVESNNEVPVKCYRTTPADAYNHWQVEFLNQYNDWNPETIEYKDQANIEDNGLKSAPLFEAHEITNPSVALKVAQNLCNRSLDIRNTYEFNLSWAFSQLEPMDLVTITDPMLGLDRQLVRILEIEELDDSTLKMTAEEMVVTAGAALYSREDPEGHTPNSLIEPGNANAPVIIIPPLALTNNQPELWMATAGGENWGGCNIWISQDASNFSQIGVLSGKSRYGILTSDLPAASTSPDENNTLGVDLSVSGGELLPGTTGEAEDLRTLCYVGGEYLAYRDAELTGINKYDLGYLVRGCFGSEMLLRDAGKIFIRLDNAIFKLDMTRADISQIIYIKLQSFNIYGKAVQDLNNLSTYQYVIESPGDQISTGAKGIYLANNAVSPDTKVDVSFEYVDLVNAIGSIYTAPSQGVSIDCETTGVNGLDTGSLDADQWYYIFIIANAMQGTIAGLVSLSPTDPLLPTGYTHKAFMGAIRSNASSHFIKIKQNGADTLYDVPQLIATGSTAQNWTNQDCSTTIPPMSTRAWVSILAVLEDESGAVNSSLAVRRNGSAGLGQIIGTCLPGSSGRADGWVDTNDEQEVELYLSNPVTSWSFYVSGFKLNI